VLNHADFAPVFGVGSMAEVPITGLINNQVISAQIDRMVVSENEILIVDFKTNRPSPKNVKDVPQIYKKQLKAYQDVMAKIYPNHNIRTALLWTDRAELMEIV
jgi:ATP-dependent helicase/nuclease subunit A